MSSLVVVIAIAVMLVAVLLIIPRIFRKPPASSRAKQKLSSSESGSEVSQWRAVRIAPGLMSCSAVQKLARTRFLASNSPSLPLQNCSQRECKCKYVHLDDRRSGGDRRVELGELGAFLPVNRVERRLNMGRRATDLAA